MTVEPPDPLARFRQPAYTGANRCLPCTVVNVVIAVVLAALASVLATPVGGAVVLGASLLAIWLRGYLVPGTPELTKRYLPDRVLRWFGKAPEVPDPGETVDVERYLVDVGALRTTEDGDDLELTESFATAWTEGIEAARAAPAETAGEVLELAAPGIEQRGEATVVTEDELRAADWPSRAALLADLGAYPALAARDPEWPDRDRTEQGRILAGLRIFAEDCPDCGGDPKLGEETVESCCRQAQVYTYACTDCGARLLEVEQ